MASKKVPSKRVPPKKAPAKKAVAAKPTAYQKKTAAAKQVASKTYTDKKGWKKLDPKKIARDNAAYDKSFLNRYVRPIASITPLGAGDAVVRAITGKDPVTRKKYNRFTAAVDAGIMLSPLKGGKIAKGGIKAAKTVRSVQGMSASLQPKGSKMVGNYIDNEVAKMVKQAKQIKAKKAVVKKSAPRKKK